MARRVRWTRLALADLEDAHAYLKEVAPAGWAEIAASIRSALALIKRHPKAGRVVPERGARAYREFVIPPYRLVYAIAGNELHVPRFWHARRDPKVL